MKRGNKGQFYIIAAVAIILIVASIVVLQVRDSEREKSRVYDLSEELNLETGYVYDHGIYNKNDTSELISNWTTTYREAVAAGKEESWVMVFGNEENLTAIQFTPTSAGEISLGGLGIDIKILTQKETNINPNGSRFNVTFANFTTTFKLKKGQNFYSIIKKGKYIARAGEENVTPAERGGKKPECGDGKIGPGEDCEPGNLNNMTCEKLNKDEGNLSCYPSDYYIKGKRCKFNTTGCEH